MYLPSDFRCNLRVHGLVEEDEIQHLLENVLVVPLLGLSQPEAVDGDHALIKARIRLRRPRMEDVGEIQRPIGE